MHSRSLRIAAALALTLGLAACNKKAERGENAFDERGTAAPGAGAGESRESLGTSGAAAMPATAGDASTGQDFAAFAAMANKAEIEIGGLAPQRAKNADVRQFAAMLVTDH